ncbi:putative uncharacterized protein [Dorea sp. CAG:317]|nr:putative uncharacterized protein [Dorea sp. CAG:317]
MNVLEKILEEIERKRKSIIDMSDEEPELVDVEDWFDEGVDQGKLIAYEVVKEIIRSHMDEAKDTNVPSNVDWIPVEEGLPEETGYYLAQLSRRLPNEDYSDRVIVLYNGEEKEFMCYANLIIAWQPLPERYKGGDDRA